MMESVTSTRSAGSRPFGAVALRSLDGVARAVEMEQKRHLITAPASRPFHAATLAFSTWSQGRLQLASLQGSLVKTGCSLGGTLKVGLVESGRVSVWLNGAQMELRAGQGLLFLPGDLAIQRFEDSTQLVVELPLASLGDLRLVGGSFRARQCFARTLNGADAAELARLCRLMNGEWGVSHGGPSCSQAQIEAIGSAILARTRSLMFGCEACLPFDHHVSHLIDDFAASLAYIHRNLDRRLTVRELAAGSAQSVRQVHRVFSSVCGATPAEFIDRVHLNWARLELVDVAMERADLRTVAQKAGWPSLTRFRDAYAAEFGQTAESTMEGIRRGLASLAA